MQDRTLYSIQESRRLLGGISRNMIYHVARQSGWQARQSGWQILERVIFEAFGSELTWLRGDFGPYLGSSSSVIEADGVLRRCS